MTRLRVWVALLTLLAAGPVFAECGQVSPVDFGTPRTIEGESNTSINGFAFATQNPLTQDADIAWQRPGKPSSQEAGICAAAWLSNAAHWDSSDPLTEGERNLELAWLALAYLKVRSFATDGQRVAIEPWLTQLADMATEKAKLLGSHRYWLALGLGATSIATGSARHWQQARAIAENAAKSIAADGTLPTEAAREKPLEAHIFALMPLITLATLARTQGDDFYALGDNALDRLATFVAKSLSEQPDTKPGAGWSQLYALHAPESPAAKIPMPRNYPALGGDVQMLVRSLQPTEPE